MEGEGRADRILAEWRHARDAGKSVDPDDVIRAHPDLADVLRQRFEALGPLQQGFAELRRRRSPPPGRMGDYRILREIRRGGMGVVYEAEQTMMRRRVALKVLPLSITRTPQAVKRFQREARAAGRLHHTNIVPVYALDQYEGHWYYAMELVHGRPLSRVIADLKGLQGHPLDESLALLTCEEIEPTVEETEAAAGSDVVSESATQGLAYYRHLASMFAGVAEALDVAHHERIVHRDIKPSNLMLDEDGVLKIVDFGLARLEDESLSMTMTGDILGTPYYMSPEQALARRGAVDGRTDIYSLGATLYEVVTLHRPFEGRNLQDLCSQILTKDPVQPRRRVRRVPRDLETIVLKAMEKEAAKRYATAGALARDLRRFAEGATVQARRITPVERAWRKVRRHKVRSALVAAVLVLAVVGGILYAKGRREEARRIAIEYDMLCAQGEDALIRNWAQAQHPAPVAVEESSPVALFTVAIELLPERVDAYFGRSRVVGRSVERSLEDLEAARERGLPLRTYHLARADLLRGEKAWDDADREEALGRALVARTATDAYFEGRWLMLRGRRQEAIDRLTRAIDGSPRGSSVRTRATHARALALVREDRLEAALQDLLALQTAGDHSMRTAVTIASVWRRLGHKTIAEQQLARAIEDVRKRDRPRDWLALTAACHAVQDFEWHDRVTELAIAAHPDRPWLLTSRADALMSLERYEEAYEVSRRAAELAPNEHQPRCSNANVLMRLGRYEEALAEYDQALAIAEECEAAHENRAIMLMDLRRYEESFAAYERCIAINPNRDTTRANYALALQRAGHLERAGEQYEVALRLEPRAATCRANHARYLTLLGRPQEALEEAARAMALDPEHAPSYASRAKAHWALGRHEEAFADLRRAMELAPDTTNHPADLGAYLQRLGRDEEAIGALDKALDIDPENYESHYNRGISLHNLARFEEAHEAYQRAHEIAPHDADVLHNIGVNLGAMGRFEEALAAYDKALTLAPNDPMTHHCRGQLLLDLGHFGDALASFEQALRHYEQMEAQIHADHGRALRGVGRMAEARKAFERALALLGSGADVAFERGEVLEALGDPRAARAAYERALERDPDHEGAHFQLGILLSQAGEQEAALLHYDRVIELNPHSSGAYANRGIALLLLGRIEEAIEAYRRALVIHPNNWRAANNLGTALLRLERYEEAFQAFKLCLDRNPTAHIALLGSGLARVHLGHPEEALEFFERATAAHPNSMIAHTNRAAALEELGRHVEAKEALERAILVAPGKPAPVNNLAWLLANCADHALRDIPRAVELARRACELNPTGGRPRGTLAMALYRTGDWAAALAVLEESSKLKGAADSTNLFIGALIHHRMGKEAEAHHLYERGVAWMEDHAGNKDLERLRGEAKELLGVSE